MNEFDIPLLATTVLRNEHLFLLVMAICNTIYLLCSFPINYVMLMYSFRISSVFENKKSDESYPKILFLCHFFLFVKTGSRIAEERFSDFWENLTYQKSSSTALPLKWGYLSFRWTAVHELEESRYNSCSLSLIVGSVCLYNPRVVLEASHDRLTCVGCTTCGGPFWLGGNQFFRVCVNCRNGSLLMKNCVVCLILYYQDFQQNRSLIIGGVDEQRWEQLTSLFKRLAINKEIGNYTLQFKLEKSKGKIN